MSSSSLLAEAIIDCEIPTFGDGVISYIGANRMWNLAYYSPMPRGANHYGDKHDPACWVGDRSSHLFITLIL